MSVLPRCKEDSLALSDSPLCTQVVSAGRCNVRPSGDYMQYTDERNSQNVIYKKTRFWNPFSLQTARFHTGWDSSALLVPTLLPESTGGFQLMTVTWFLISQAPASSVFPANSIYLVSGCSVQNIVCITHLNKLAQNISSLFNFCLSEKNIPHLIFQNRHVEYI